MGFSQMLFLRVFFLLVFGLQMISESFCDESKGIKFYGEYLNWRVVQDQMQYAAVLLGGVQQIIDRIEILEETNQLNVSEKISLVDPSFKCHSGFRLGLGYENTCSDWDVQLA